MARKFNPLLADHPIITDKRECPVCNEPFKAGDITTLVALGPGNAEDRAKAKAGKPYNAVAHCVHWDCCAEEYKEYDE